MTLLESLQRRLGSRDPEERRKAIADLSHAAELPVALLVQGLSDSDWRVRKEAVLVCVSLSAHRELLGALVKALSHPEDVGLRNAAVEALGGFGEHAIDALAVELTSLRLDADGRKLAVEALARTGRPAALPILSTLLADSDPNVRLAAAEAVVALGVAGVGGAAAVLEQCLGSPEPLVALAALEGANALGITLAWPTLERCLKEPALRRSALIAMGRSRDPRATPILMEALNSARGREFLELTRALSDLAPEEATARGQPLEQVSRATGARLVACVRQEGLDEDARRAALVVVALFRVEGAAECAVEALADERFLADAHHAIELLGPRALKALVAGAHAGDADARANCLALLARLAEPTDAAATLAVAREALSDPAAEVQRQALAVLAHLGDASCMDEVAQCLHSQASASTAKAASVALREMALRHPEAARSLASSIRPDDPRAHAACIAIAALGVQGSPSDADLPFLSAALASSEGAVRRAAIEALAEISGKGSVEAVAFALTDEERDVRAAAVVALGRIRSEDGSSPGAPHLIDLVQRSRDAELVAAAIHALGESGDPRGVAVLKPLTRSGEPFVAVSALEALARLSGEHRVEALLDGLQHADAEVVKATMLALCDAAADARVLTHLGACLGHDAWDVRRLAADLLGRVSGDGALVLLRERLASEASPMVQEAIARSVAHIAGIRRSLLPPMGSLRPR